MRSVTNKIKELKTPTKKKTKQNKLKQIKLSPERVKINNTTNTSRKEQKQTDKKLDAGKRKAKN